MGVLNNQVSAPRPRAQPLIAGNRSTSIRSLRDLLLLLVAIAGGSGLCPPPQAAADDSPAAPSRPIFSCERDYKTVGDLAKSDASMDLYHGLAFVAGGAAIDRGGNPSRRWSRKNGFDTGLRSGFRLNSTDARKDAALASDLTLVLSSVLLPAATIGAEFARTRDCVETWDMFTDMIESLGLTLFITQAVKLAAGRERPFTGECGVNAPSDADCDKESRHLSFFSGHASLAAAGAGLTCSFSIGRDAWGSSRAARLTPCALGAAAAFTTGALRMASDKHWGSDVLLGFAVGALVGYFDTWGPLDLVKFSTRDNTGRVTSRGIVLPQAVQGRLGAQLLMVF